jgi:hypothetical protein
MPVLIGASADGTKEVIAISDGFRECELSWSEVLPGLKNRELEQAPMPAVGDGALGFWIALRKIFPETKEQRCRFHKKGSVARCTALASRHFRAVGLRCHPFPVVPPIDTSEQRERCSNARSGERDHQGEKRCVTEDALDSLKRKLNIENASTFFKNPNLLQILSYTTIDNSSITDNKIQCQRRVQKTVSKIIVSAKQRIRRNSTGDMNDDKARISQMIIK